MRSVLLTFALGSLLPAVCLTVSSPAQTDPQAASLLQASAKALGAPQIQDVTLSVSLRQIAGSSDTTIPATFEALNAGSTQILYSGFGGAVSETRSWGGNAIRTGNWTDAQGSQHPLAHHNMLAEPAWFFSPLAVQHAADDTFSVASYIGAETFNGHAVQHIALTSVALASAGPQVQALSRTELYLDAGTLLPVGISFVDHPDATLNVNIPVTVLYSQYQSMSGATIPTHVQQIRNGSLFLDLQVQNVKLNSGLTIPSTQAE